MTAKIFSVTNQKGGVGKTTTSVNLSASLHRAKKKVLLIDLDPQGNATMGSGIDKNDCDLTAYDLLLALQPAQNIIVSTPEAGYDLLPANGDLTAAEVDLIEAHNREFRLKTALGPIAENYDYILIDCPPSLNMLTVNALVASDGVIIPMQCEYYALEGLSALSETIEAVKAAVNPNLGIEGILRTMYDPRNRLTNEVSDQLKEYFGDKVYRTVIPRNVRLAEAPSYGQPIIVYDKESRGALSYLALAGEIIRRNNTEADSQPGDNGIAANPEYSGDSSAEQPPVTD